MTTPTYDLERTFDETFDCYVINLARTPERMAAFLGRNGASGIAFNRFEAIDGNTLDFDETVRLGIVKPMTRWSNKATIGVAMSHRKLWDKAVADKRSLIVFEDDAWLRRDAKAAFMAAIAGVADWDIVLLGYNTDSVFEFNVINDIDLFALFQTRYPTPAQLTAFAAARDPVRLFGLRHAFGTCGYAISPQGAARLRAACFPMDNRMLEFPPSETRFPAFSVDCMMNDAYRNIAAFACLPPLVLSPNDKASSTIARRSGGGPQRR